MFGGLLSTLTALSVLRPERPRKLQVQTVLTKQTKLQRSPSRSAALFVVLAVRVIINHAAARLSPTALSQRGAAGYLIVTARQSLGLTATSLPPSFLTWSVWRRLGPSARLLGPGTLSNQGSVPKAAMQSHSSAMRCAEAMLGLYPLMAPCLAASLSTIMISCRSCSLPSHSRRATTMGASSAWPITCSVPSILPHDLWTGSGTELPKNSRAPSAGS